MRYSLFFNPEQGVYDEQCNKRVVEKAMELGVVRRMRRRRCGA